MIMLSRVAERLYWMARYLERAEDTARLTKAYTHLIMDIPAESQPGWDILVRILDAQTSFSEHHRACNEQNVLKFLIADEENPGSVHYCIRAARENVRTTRDVLPEEVWEHVNGLYLFSQEHAAKSVGRRNRHQFLDQVITRCQMISGLLMSTLCRDHAYRFIKLGALLERADMTTRIIDVGAGALLGNERLNKAVDPLIWACLLQSLSAMGTYRRTIGPLVGGELCLSRTRTAALCQVLPGRHPARTVAAEAARKGSQGAGSIPAQPGAIQCRNRRAAGTARFHRPFSAGAEHTWRCDQLHLVHVRRGYVPRGYVRRGYVRRGYVRRGDVQRGDVPRGYVRRGNVPQGMSHSPGQTRPKQAVSR